MKAMKVIGAVVAVVAIVASAGTLLAPAAAAVGTTAATAGGFAGISAATLGTIGTVASITAGVLGAATAAFARKPSFNQAGNPLQFQTNPQSGLPYAIGRTRMSGLRIHADTYDGFKLQSKDDILSFAVLLSAGGESEAIESFTADKELVTFDGSGNAIGGFTDFMAQKVSLGLIGASALALSFGGGGFPGWTSAHKLSGMAHALWDLRYDAKGEHYGAGVPEPTWIGKWVKVYDPRKDSTYPGGSGSHRALDEATYEWSNNPFLHALTWALGRWQNGKKTLGIGAPIANIIVSNFVEGANVADENGWTCGGVEYSTDSKWDILKRMLQAGGAEPTMTGAMIGCRVNTPRVSIATVEAADLLDSATFAATRSRRDRFNTVIPRYRSEDHDWEVISGKPIAVSAYVTDDGGGRTKEIDFPLVQAELGQTYDGNVQAGQLATYEIVNSREAGPWTFTTGPKFYAVKTGDCITLNVPLEGIPNQPVLVREVRRDPATLKFTFTVETETADKHDFALGKTSIPPGTWSPTPPDLTPPIPDASLWAITTGFTGERSPSIIIDGVCEFPGADDINIEYRKVGDTDWINTGEHVASEPAHLVLANLEPLTDYEAHVSYRSDNRVGGWLDLGPVTTPDPTPAIPGPGSFTLSTSSTGAGQPLLVVEGTSDFADADTVLVDYRATADADWTSAGSYSVAEPLLVTIGGVTGDTEYEARVSYKAKVYQGPWLELTAVTTPVDAVQTAVENYEASNDQNADAIVNPTITTSGSAVDHTLNTNGSVDISFEWSWGGSEADIDGFEVLALGRTSSSAYTVGSSPATEHTVVLRSDRRNYVVFGANPLLYYTFAVRAYRQVSPSVDLDAVIYSNWVKPSLTGENPYHPETALAFDGDITGTIEGIDAAIVASAATNFNTRNDRLGTTPTAPTITTGGSAVDHSINTDGSADISLEWNYSGSEADIDGFEVLVMSRTSSSTYTLGSATASERVSAYPAYKRAMTLFGVPANLYYTFAVRSYRVVDPDVTAGGVLYSAWVRPSSGDSENPYRPTASVAFQGDMAGTISTLPRMVNPGDLDVMRRYDANLFGGQFPVAMKFTRMKGETDVSASTTWTIDEAWPTTTGLTLSSSGLMTIANTFVTSIGWFVVKSVYEGVSEYRRIVMNNIFSPPPVGLSDYTVFPATTDGASITTTTPPGTLLYTTQCKAGAGGIIDLGAIYWAWAENGVQSPAGGIAFLARYRPAGSGSYTDGPSAGQQVYHGATYPKAVIAGMSPGNQITGLTPNALYDIQVYAYRTSTAPQDATSVRCAPASNVIQGK